MAQHEVIAVRFGQKLDTVWALADAKPHDPPSNFERRGLDVDQLHGPRALSHGGEDRE